MTLYASRKSNSFRAKLQQTTELSHNTSFAKLYLPAATGSLCATKCHRIVETECPRLAFDVIVDICLKCVYLAIHYQRSVTFLLSFKYW